MLLADGFAPLKIGDGSDNLEDSGEGAGRKTQPIGEQFQHPAAGGVQFTVFPEVTGVREWR